MSERAGTQALGREAHVSVVARSPRGNARSPPPPAHQSLLTSSTRVSVAGWVPYTLPERLHTLRVTHTYTHGCVLLTHSWHNARKHATIGQRRMHRQTAGINRHDSSSSFIKLIRLSFYHTYLSLSLSLSLSFSLFRSLYFPILSLAHSFSLTRSYVYTISSFFSRKAIVRALAATPEQAMRTSRSPEVRTWQPRHTRNMTRIGCVFFCTE